MGIECDWPGCSHVTRCSQNMKYHKNIHLDIKPYKCKDCDFAAANPASVSHHRKRVHTKIKSHRCTYDGCSYESVDSSSLQVHQRIHTNDRKYKCDFPRCGYACTKSGTLSDHKKIHSNEKNYKSDFEGCKFATKHQRCLNTHLESHKNVKKFKCNHCQYTAATNQQLQNHIRTHTKETPFECPFPGCGHACAQEGQLKRHALTHEENKAFVCDHPGCDFSSRLRQGLDRHQLLHSGELPFACRHEGCDEAFNRSDNLKAHEYQYHTRKGQQERKRQEKRIADLLTSNGIDFKREHHITFTCLADSFARVDFVIVQEGQIVFLEVDESQHSSYGVVCDVSRMLKIRESLLLGGNTLPVRFIRYNPHAYQVDGKTKRTNKKDREKKLLEVVRSATLKISDFSIQYLFYDVVDSRNVIWDDEAFVSTDLEACCLPPLF